MEIPPILFRPITRNGNYPAWFAEHPLCGEIFRSWKKVFPDSRYCQSLIDVDKEEFIENAARLDAILTRYPGQLAIVDEFNDATLYSTREHVP